jgi:hypothetical protein
MITRRIYKQNIPFFVRKMNTIISLKECELCPNPCDLHESAPSSVMKKIDCDVDIEGSVKYYKKQLLICAPSNNSLLLIK